MIQFTTNKCFLFGFEYNFTGMQFTDTKLACQQGTQATLPKFGADDISESILIIVCKYSSLQMTIMYTLTPMSLTILSLSMLYHHHMSLKTGCLWYNQISILSFSVYFLIISSFFAVYEPESRRGTNMFIHRP